MQLPHQRPIPPTYSHRYTMSVELWTPPPLPATANGFHRKLAPTAGVRVSPISLGAMSIGDKWDSIGMGAMDKDSSFKLLDAYYNGGGNFIDTANSYQDESSEEFLGEWMETRGIRDQMVIATKVCVQTLPLPKQSTRR